jgi:hypothetical protein
MTLALFSLHFGILLRLGGAIAPRLLSIPLQFSGDGAWTHPNHLGYLVLFVSPDVQGLDTVTVVFG